MPTTVMQKRSPRNKCDNISKNPPKIIQMMLSKNLPAPPPYTTSLPKGQRANPAILKACRPMGMPMMEMQYKMPRNSHAMAINKPPNRNQIKFPINRTVVPPLFYMPPAMTRMGVVLPWVVPLPNWPKLLLPQAHTEPSWVTINMWGKGLPVNHDK